MKKSTYRRLSKIKKKPFQEVRKSYDFTIYYDNQGLLWERTTFNYLYEYALILGHGRKRYLGKMSVKPIKGCDSFEACIIPRLSYISLKKLHKTFIKLKKFKNIKKRIWG